MSEAAKRLLLPGTACSCERVVRSCCSTCSEPTTAAGGAVGGIGSRRLLLLALELTLRPLKVQAVATIFTLSRPGALARRAGRPRGRRGRRTQCALHRPVPCCRRPVISFTAEPAAVVAVVVVGWQTS